MDRITGSDALGMMEAYNAVYTPQELTEEQVWEEVEVWVNSLVEEGYDLSEYTWEDMYDAYLSEDAREFGASLRQRFGQARRAIGDVAGAAAQGIVGQRTTSSNPVARAYNAVTRGVSAPSRGALDAAGAAAQGIVGQRTTSSNPVARAYNAVTRGVTTPSRVLANVATGFATGKPSGASSAQNTGMYGRYQSPSSQQYGNQSRFAGARDAAFERARQIQGSPVVGPRLGGSGTTPPQTRPVPPQTRPTAAPAGTSRPNAPTRPATPSYSGATGVRPVGTPLPTGAVTPVAGAPAQNATVSAPASRPSLAAQAAELRAMRKASQQRIIAQGGTPATPLVQSFDPFDVVMGYLIDEGYAENEEAASVIMANMSEEWRQSIVEQSAALLNTIDTLEKKVEKMNQRQPGSANLSRRGEQTPAAALYKAYGRLRGV